MNCRNYHETMKKRDDEERGDWINWKDKEKGILVGKEFPEELNLGDFEVGY